MPGEGSLFAGPGLLLDITDATVNADNQFEVEYTITDEEGNPLDRNAVRTPGGAVATTFVFAYLDPDIFKYVSFVTRTETADGVTVVQATGENDGTFEQIELGTYRYTSNATVPADILGTDVSYRVAVYAERPFEDIDWVSNAVFDFTTTNAAPVSREVVLTENCNACHAPLEAHGGVRRIVPLCITCHTPQTTDAETGRTVDMTDMTHKIHMGVNLPSVVTGPVGAQYAISGFRDRLQVYSEKVGPDEVVGVRYPRPITQCGACHAGAQDAERILTNVTIENCQSCHDNVAFIEPVPEGFVLHTAGVQPPDSCPDCHGVGAFASVQDVHRSDFEFIQDEQPESLLGLELGIVGATNVEPGATPTVEFTVTDASGNLVPLASLSTLRAVFAWPTAQIMESFRVDLLGATQTNGTYTATATTALPTDLSTDASVAVGLEGYQTITATRGGEEISVREAAFNPVAAFGVGGDAGVPRQMIVAQEKCESCHGEIDFVHGGFRKNVQYCGLCHHENATDADVRPIEAGPPVSIRFMTMAHKIHTGEELNQLPYIIYGFRSSVHDYSDVRYPGQLNDCTDCHVNETWQKANTAVCTSCHDSDAALAHAELNTTASGVQTCEICHGPGQDFGVDVVHQPIP